MSIKKHIFTQLFLFLVFLTPIFGVSVYAQEPPPPVDVQSQPRATTSKVDAEGKYTFIAPISNYFSGEIDLLKEDALMKYIRTWFGFAIGIAGVIGVVRLVMAGFEIVMGASGNINAVARAKKEIFAIAGSLALVGASWIFLNTLNPRLVTQSLLVPITTGKEQMRQQCSEQDQTNCADQSPRDRQGNLVSVDQNGVPVLSDNITAGITGSGFYFLYTKRSTGQKFWQGPFPTHDDCKKFAKKIRDDVNSDFLVNLAQGSDETPCTIKTTHSTAEEKGAEEAARAILTQGGASYNKTYCSNPAATANGCTNLIGLQSNTLYNITGLAQMCQATLGKKCDIVLTGGTEPGHKTHGTQYGYTVDLRATPSLTEFLQKNATVIARSFMKEEPDIRYLYKGWWYTYEPSGGVHYHVCMNNAGGNYSQTGQWYCYERYAVSKGKNGVPPPSWPINYNDCKVSPNNPNQKDCRELSAPVEPIPSGI